MTLREFARRTGWPYDELLQLRWSAGEVMAARLIAVEQERDAARAEVERLKKNLETNLEIRIRAGKVSNEFLQRARDAESALAALRERCASRIEAISAEANLHGRHADYDVLRYAAERVRALELYEP